MKSERNNPLETMALFALVSLAAGLIFKFKYSVHLSSLFLIIGLFIKPLAQLISDLWLKWGELKSKIRNQL
ncbi:MAG: hypothetical protein MJK18_05285, partial [Bdellovibrionales bacterium]|nr:hypothetical protein [Bdellovibrionales bacterium]